MFRKVTMILEAVQQLPAEKRPLRVAAYCRVSTNHEEQQRSLATKSATTPITSKTIPIGYWLECILILHLVLALISAPAAKNS